MGFGGAELFDGGFLAGGGFDDVGTADEHLGGLAGHDEEVHEGGTVGSAAGAGAGDDGDLGNKTGEFDVAVEDFAVAGEGMDAFLDAGTAGVVDGDHRNAEGGGGFHHVADFLGVHATQGAAGDGEVLREGGDRAAADVADAGDDAVTGHFAVVHAGGVVVDVHAGFLEGAGVVEVVKALAGVHEAALPTFLELVLPSPCYRRFSP